MHNSKLKFISMSFILKEKGREGGRRKEGRKEMKEKTGTHGPSLRGTRWGGDECPFHQGTAWRWLCQDSPSLSARSTGASKVSTTPSSLWLKGNQRGKKVEHHLSGSIYKLNQMYCSKFTVGHLFFFLISFQYWMKGWPARSNSPY